MVSRDESETSSDTYSPLTEEHDLDPYRPATIEDMDWSGIDPTGMHLCQHGKSPERQVIFEGPHTGRRIYGCAEKEGYNCGVVEWVDDEWPNSMKNTLNKLWAMYEGAMADNQAKDDKFAKLAAEMKEVQENYNKNIKLTRDFCTNVHNSVMRENFKNIMMENQCDDDCVGKVEKENTELKKELDVLKKNLDSQAELIGELKKEKKSLNIA